MLVNGSCSAKYAEYLIENPKNKVLFTGYLDEESPGNQLVNHLIDNSTLFNLNHKNFVVRAGIQPYHLSAHASLEQIIQLVEQVHPRHAMFIHGYPSFEVANNLFKSFYHWGRQGINPFIVHNKSPVYF